jgi:hypothetical protein
MSRDTVYALLVVAAMVLAMGFAGAADYEAQLILDEPLSVMIADGAR